MNKSESDAESYLVCGIRLESFKGAFHVLPTRHRVPSG